MSTSRSTLREYDVWTAMIIYGWWRIPGLCVFDCLPKQPFTVFFSEHVTSIITLVSIKG